MKRLEEGDECYIRNGCGDLFVAYVMRVGKRGMQVKIPAKKGLSQILGGGDYHGKNPERTNAWSLVYPFPIIKQLAK